MFESKKDRALYTLIGVFLMANTTAFFNKYLVYHVLDLNLLKEVVKAFLMKAPVAFVMQYYVIQPWVAENIKKYDADNTIVLRCIRVGYTVMVMCPFMCLFSNAINMIQLHWNASTMIINTLDRMPLNWLFAFCIQVWFLKPLNDIIYAFIKHDPSK